MYISNHEPDPDRVFNYDIFTVNVSNARIHQLTHTESVEYKPKWSPDGKTIAYLGTHRGLATLDSNIEDTHVWLMNADGSNRRELGASIDNRQRTHGWTIDGRAILCAVMEQGSWTLYRLPIDSGRPDIVLEHLGGWGISWSIGKNGTLAYSTRTRKDLAQLYLKKGRAAPKQLTDLNESLFSERAVADVESMVFKSFDAKQVEAFLTLPLGRTAGSKHPLIVMIKGGPHGQSGPYFNYAAQVFAARGWASLTVNYRGSTGYGQAFTDAIFGQRNGAEAKDVMFAVDAAVRRNSWIDSERLGIQGKSYGGQLSMWIITQTNRFKAAIPKFGISNHISFNYMAYFHDFLAAGFGGYLHQEDLMDLLWEQSALKHIAKVTTPTMLVHGEDDTVVPIAESEQFYIALKDVGVETIMVRYPREGHGVTEIGHQIDLIERSIDWYEKYFPRQGVEGDREYSQETD